MEKTSWQRTTEDLKQEQNAIEDVAKRLCWKKVVEKGDLAVWQKPMNHIDCMKNRKPYNVPHICKNDNLDAAWYTKMETCITPLPEVNDINAVAGGALEKWPKRVTAVPPQIRIGASRGRNYDMVLIVFQVLCKISVKPRLAFRSFH